MHKTIRLVFDIEPVQQQRPRAVRFGRGVRMYDPPKTAAFKKLLRLLAMKQYREKPLEGPLKVKFDFYRKVQSSISHVEHDRRISGQHRPIMKPDLSNYLKSAEDALNGVIWQDDALIVDEEQHKHYSDHPRIELVVEAKDEDQ